MFVAVATKQNVLFNLSHRFVLFIKTIEPKIFNTIDLRLPIYLHFKCFFLTCTNMYSYKFFFMVFYQFLQKLNTTEYMNSC